VNEWEVPFIVDVLQPKALVSGILDRLGKDRISDNGKCTHIS